MDTVQTDITAGKLVSVVTRFLSVSLVSSQFQFLITLESNKKTGSTCDLFPYSVRTEFGPNGANSVLRVARVRGDDAGRYSCSVARAPPPSQPPAHVILHVIKGKPWIYTWFFRFSVFFFGDKSTHSFLKFNKTHKPFFFYLIVLVVNFKTVNQLTNWPTVSRLFVWYKKWKGNTLGRTR